MRRESIGEFEQLVLLAILRQGSEAYGGTIIDELSSHTARSILRPSVYLALRRLEDKGMITSRMGEPEPRRGGRARKYFEVAPAGLTLIRETRRTLVSLWSGLDPHLDES